MAMDFEHGDGGSNQRNELGVTSCFILSDAAGRSFHRSRRLRRVSYFRLRAKD